MSEDPRCKSIDVVDAFEDDFIVAVTRVDNERFEVFVDSRERLRELYDNLAPIEPNASIEAMPARTVN